MPVTSPGRDAATAQQEHLHCAQLLFRHAPALFEWNLKMSGPAPCVVTCIKHDLLSKLPLLTSIAADFQALPMGSSTGVLCFSTIVIAAVLVLKACVEPGYRFRSLSMCAVWVVPKFPYWRGLGCYTCSAHPSFKALRSRFLGSTCFLVCVCIHFPALHVSSKALLPRYRSVTVQHRCNDAELCSMYLGRYRVLSWHASEYRGSHCTTG